jgi:hypothetical protein
MDLDGLVEPATLKRLRQAQEGHDTSRHLAIAALAPGGVGILEATVAQVGAVRDYTRKRGGKGELCRVILSDGTAEVDLVLWDDEVRHTRDGLLRPGARIRLSGATVKAGYRGGVELGLGSARLELVPPTPSSPAYRFTGVLQELGETRIVGEPPNERFQADAVVASDGAESRIVLEGETVKAARAMGAGATIILEAVIPHPVLPGWFLATPGTRLIAPPGRKV